MRLGTNNTTNYVELKAPSGMASNWTMTLPATTNGIAGSALTDTTGSGSFGWTTPITALTGDVTATGPGSATATIAKIVNHVYVDFASGSDVSSGGTPWHPWKTMQYACNHISPTINIPINIIVSGGNNDTDVYPITCPPNIAVNSPEYGIQMHGVTITGGTTNDGVTFTNVLFTDNVTWVRNDNSAIGLTFNNSGTFGSLDFEQQGAGTASTILTIFGANSFLGGMTVQAGTAIFQSAGFLFGTLNYKDSGAASLLMSGGIQLSAPTIQLHGGVTAEFAGLLSDGQTITCTTTGSGTPTVKSDAGSIPTTLSGCTFVPYSHAQWMAYSPATPANWSSAPTTVAGALDTLAIIAGKVPVTVPNGGTGDTTLTSNGVLYGNGTGAVNVTAQGAANSVLVANAGAPSFSQTPTINTNLTVGVNGSQTGAFLLANGGVGGQSVTFQNTSTTTGWNFNLPTSAGTSGQPLLSGGGGGSVMTFGTLGTGAGGTGLSSLGSANQILGVNAGATGLEYKTVSVGTTGTDFNVANAANSLTLNLPDASATARGAVTTGTQTFGGAKTFASDVTLNTNLTYTITNDSTTTGSNATLSHPTTFIRLTNVSLVSIACLANAGNGHTVAVINATGNRITLVNNSGACAGGSQPILTATGADATIPSNGGAQFINSNADNAWFIDSINRGVQQVADGGTGLTSGTSGGILGYTASGTLASSAALTANGVVLGGGAGATPTSTSAGTADQVFVVPHAGGAPAFGQVDLSQSAAVKNQLPVGNGGTGIASGTSGGIPYFSGSTTIASSAALTAHGVVIGGGAGTSPTSTAAGTNGQLLIGNTSADPTWGNTVSIATTFSAGLVGVNTNSTAASTIIGEEMHSGAQTVSPCSSSANYIRAATISPTAGDWDIQGACVNNGSGASGSFINACITTTDAGTSCTSTNTACDSTTFSLNKMWGAYSTTPQVSGLTIPAFQINLSGTTAYYINVRTDATAANSVICNIRARRMR